MAAQLGRQVVLALEWMGLLLVLVGQGSLPQPVERKAPQEGVYGVLLGGWALPLAHL